MPIINRRIFFNFIFLIIPFICKGQSYYFRHYQADDGLAHNAVMTILQDKKGFMWFGTKGGLNRFDGYTFKLYKNNKNKFGNIGNNVITSLCEDQKGMIWVGTGHGIFKYNPDKESFEELQFKHSPDTGQTKPLLDISQIRVDRANNLWFLADGNLYNYDQANNKVISCGFRASCIAFDNTMQLWAGTGDGLIKKYDPVQRAITASIKVFNDDVPLYLRFITRVFLTDNNTILIGTNKQGLKSYDLKTGEIKSLLARNKDKTEIYVRNIIATAQNEYWIATESGIYIYNTKTNTSQNIKKYAGDNYSLNDNAVYSLFKDNQDGIWAGTYFGGINYISKENSRFEKYYPVNSVNSISGNAVREICEDRSNNIWIGTEDAGINKLDTKTNTFTTYTASGKPGEVSYPNIHGLLAVDDRLYIGPFLHGLEIMDIKTGRITDRFKLIRSKDNHISDFVMSIYKTTDGKILIGTIGAGLFIFDPDKKTFTKVEAFPGGGYIYSILEDHEATIWTSSLIKGAYYYNPRTSKKGNIRFNRENDNDYLIQGIFEDSNHAIWFATEGGGLIKLNADHKTFKKFTTQNGLPTNNIFRILEDDEKNLWISSLKGLICLNLKTEKFKVYTQSNGLITDQFNYNSAFKDHTGKMYFGSVKGMVAFRPGQLLQPENPPPTYITNLQINNQEALPNAQSPLSKSILQTDSIVLQHDQSSFEY